MRAWEFEKCQPNDNGCYRPVSLDDKDTNNFIIHFCKKPTYEQLEIINYRAILFERVRPYKYLDENFKYLGFEEYEVTTKNKKL